MCCGRAHVAELAALIKKHDPDLSKFGKLLGESIAQRRKREKKDELRN